MAKPKAQTIQQRFGFLDSDLTTPKHDEIMLWLDKNINALINKYVEFDYEVHFRERFQHYVNRGVPESDLVKLPAPNKPNPLIKVEKRIWEHPITTQQSQGYGNKYIVGFIDMAVVCCLPTLELLGVKESSTYTSGVPRRTYDTIDDLAWGIDHRYNQQAIFFEVKTKIESVGELLRQIRMYQTYVDKNVPFFVVSPDDRARSQIEGQGVRFIPYP